MPKPTLPISKLVLRVVLKTAAEATTESTAKMNNIIAALQKLGIEEKISRLAIIILVLAIIGPIPRGKNWLVMRCRKI